MSELFHCGIKRKKRFLIFLKRILLFFLFISVLFVLIYNLQIIPVLSPYAKAKAATEITAAVQKIIRKTVTDRNENYAYLNCDSNGNIVSLQTDAVRLSSLSAAIAESVIENLSEKERLTVKIPVGSLSGGAFFTGKGPNITIPLASTPKITCNIENEFYESGINQTMHRIIAKVNVETYVLIPSAPESISVETIYCVAETVIVGKVPDAYTKINRSNDDISESEIDDIYDFGAG